MPREAIPTIIRKPKIRCALDESKIVLDALSSPVDGRGFKQIKRGLQSACILICDITRPVPNELFLMPLVKELLSIGVKLENILILIATGLHRPNTGSELNELIGDPWILNNVRIENHDACDDQSHMYLGDTRTSNVPVLIDCRFVQADVKIVTGLVEPHFMAGYSGGRKVVVPGICHHKTIRTLHASRFMDDPCSRPCNLHQNPLHDEQVEIIRMLNCEIFGLNTVLSEDRKLLFASFGDIIESHIVAVKAARSSCEVLVSQQYKTLLTSAAGYPLDATYYQTIKGMVTPLDILEKNGTLIIVSECSEGFGSMAFRKSQGRLIELGRHAFSDELKAKRLADVDEWQTAMQMKTMAVGDIKLYAPNLKKQDKALTGVESIDNVSDAVLDSILKYNDPKVAVIPEGPYVIPMLTVN